MRVVSTPRHQVSPTDVVLHTELSSVTVLIQPGGVAIAITIRRLRVFLCDCSELRLHDRMYVDRHEIYRVFLQEF
jgi:hypothetical protein